MARFRRNKRAEWRDVAGGFAVLLAPVDFETFQLVRFRVDRQLADDGEMDPDTQAARRITLELQEFARRLVKDWRGLDDADTGEAIDFDPALLDAVCAEIAFAPRLHALMLAPMMEVFAEGEGFGAGPNGCSVAAPDTVDAAGNPTIPVPEAA